MLLEFLLASGATYAGVRRYKRQRTRHAFDLIRTANDDTLHLPQRERLAMVKQSGAALFATLEHIQERTINPLLDDLYDASAALASTHIAPRLGQRSHAYLMRIFGDDAKQEITHEEQQANRDITLGGVALVATVTGLLIFPPLTLLALPALTLITLRFGQYAFHELIHQHKIGVWFAGTLSVVSMLVLGKFLLLAVFVFIFSLTGKAVLRTRDTSRKRLVNILGDTPRFVWLLRDGTEVQLSFESLQVGDCIVVHAGELIPIDGTIVTGNASIDQHMLTGEAQPAEKHAGDLVYAGTILLAGTLHIQVEKTGSDTVAAQIGKVLDRTADYRSFTELQGLVIADYSVPIMLSLWLVTLPLLGPASATAVITCFIGFQTRLTAPLSVLNFLAMAADQGLLVKDGRALELVSAVDTVVFDKTGTLTQEQPHVGAIHTTHGYTESAILIFAAAAEHKQTHPIARAIVQAAEQRQLVIPAISDAAYTLGYGLTVQLDGQMVRVGSARFLQQEGITIPAHIEVVQQQGHAQGWSLVYVAVDDQLAGAIELHPTIRPEARTMIQRLKQRGLELYIISGDHIQPTQRLAEELGIEHVFAEVLPEEKATLIDRLQAEGRSVCFVGDGINDAIALKKAQVSVSLRGATTIAMDTAQIILLDQNLSHLLTLFDLSDQLAATMRRNLLAATVPGIISISGVYLWNFGIVMASLLSWLGLTTGITNAMLPIIQHWQTDSALIDGLSDQQTRVVPRKE